MWHTEACWWTMLREVSLRGNALADQGLCALVDVSRGHQWTTRRGTLWRVGKGGKAGPEWGS